MDDTLFNTLFVADESAAPDFSEKTAWPAYPGENPPKADKIRWLTRWEPTSPEISTSRPEIPTSDLTPEIQYGFGPIQSHPEIFAEVRTPRAPWTPARRSPRNDLNSDNRVT